MVKVYQQQGEVRSPASNLYWTDDAIYTRHHQVRPCNGNRVNTKANSTGLIFVRWIFLRVFLRVIVFIDFFVNTRRVID